MKMIIINWFKKKARINNKYNHLIINKSCQWVPQRKFYKWVKASQAIDIMRNLSQIHSAKLI